MPLNGREIRWSRKGFYETIAPEASGKSVRQEAASFETRQLTRRWSRPAWMSQLEPGVGASAAYRPVVSGICGCRATVRRRIEDEMAHSLAEIEDDALQLPPEDRARLAVDLLASLEESVESPEEIEKLWLAEAERRFQELRDGVVQGIPAREVFAQVRAKLRS
jgi:putative addiction module component (TIGR02574 family)